MKSILILSVLLVLCIVGILCFAPHYFRPGTTIESILIDKTDSLSAKPQANDIVSLLNLKGDKWQGANVRIQTISGYNYNPISDIDIASAIPLVSNPVKREKELSSFNQKVTSALDSVNLLKPGLKHSSIYMTLIAEVNNLAHFNAGHANMVVYSDLLEHSSLFNIYEPKSYQLLKNNTKQVKEVLENVMRPTKLNGMQVYFVFKPKSNFENDAFMLMANLFKSILEEAGATVHIGASLNTYKLNEDI